MTPFFVLGRMESISQYRVLTGILTFAHRDAAVADDILLADDFDGIDVDRLVSIKAIEPVVDDVVDICDSGDEKSPTVVIGDPGDEHAETGAKTSESTDTDLEGLTAAELRGIAMKMGVDHTGSKDVLKAAIIAARVKVAE